MKRNYLVLAKKIIGEHKLQKYIDIILQYWKKNPTSLGHGFSHMLKVAVTAFEVGIQNKYPQPTHLFIGGLFHDIYRPAIYASGDEDQRLGADITRKLFVANKISTDITAKVLAAIISHDEWRGLKDPPIFDLIVSIADKIVHDYTIAYNYAWAVNKYYLANTGKPVFTTHQGTLAVFNKYQQRAWEVFTKHPIKGTEEAIASYLHIYQTVADNYFKDKTGKHFFDYLEKVADIYRREEKKYLTYFGLDAKEIEK